MENISQKIREIYPVSDEALQALQANMELRYYPKDTYIVQSGVTDRLVYFIEEGIARSVFHHNGNISPLPRTSYPTPGMAGMKNIVQRRDNIIMEMATCVPSHCTQP